MASQQPRTGYATPAAPRQNAGRDAGNPKQPATMAAAYPPLAEMAFAGIFRRRLAQHLSAHAAGAFEFPAGAAGRIGAAHADAAALVCRLPAGQTPFAATPARAQKPKQPAPIPAGLLLAAQPKPIRPLVDIRRAAPMGALRAGRRVRRGVHAAHRAPIHLQLAKHAVERRQLCRRTGTAFAAARPAGL